MNILLDIDGVLVITPNWKPVELLDDGFMKFNQKLIDNLNILQSVTDANIIVTSSHREYFNIQKLTDVFRNRGIKFKTLEKLDDSNNTRAEDIELWLSCNKDERYIIIDDDNSINDLSKEIKKNWVKTMPLIGFNQEKLVEALKIYTSVA